MAAHRDLRAPCWLITSATVLLIASAAQADWAANGVKVSLGSPAGEPALATDHAGGAIVAWSEQRSGVANPAKLFLQHLNPNGQPTWQPGGVPVANTPQGQGSPFLVSKASGGALILFTAWENNGDVLMQSVSASGAIAPFGVVIAGGSDSQSGVGLVSDGQSGGYLAWLSQATLTKVFLQHVDPTGQPTWANGGIAVSAQAGDQAAPSLAPDGAGGVIVAWTDYRSGAARAYVQRFAADGTPYWTADGVPACSAISEQLNARVASDQFQGAFLAWDDRRGGLPDVYAQHLLSDGTRASVWPADGLPVAVASMTQAINDVAPDGLGGLLTLWQDALSGGGENNPDLFLQRIDSSGDVHDAWPLAGLPITRAMCEQMTGHILPEGDGGALVSWDDGRTCTRPYSGDIYVQRVRADGSVLPGWAPDGFPVCIAERAQYHQCAALVDPEHAIVAWIDGRSVFYGDIYAQQVRLADGGWETDAPNGCDREAHFLPCRQGGILFAARSSTDASQLPDGPYTFDATTLTITKEVGKAYFLSGSPDSLTYWSCDDRIFVNGTDAGLGFSSTIFHDPCLPMDKVHGRVSFRRIPSYLIPEGTSCVPFELVDTNRDILGNTAIYLYVSQTVDVPSSHEPAGLALRLVSANPARAGCDLSVDLPVRADVRLRVLDVAGRTVARLMERPMDPGSHPVRWNTERVPPGVYFVRLDATGLGRTQRIVVLP